MSAADDVSKIEACISNSLDRSAIGKKSIAGVIGDAASRYSKSPALWNSAFQSVGLEAIYLAFDIREGQLANFMNAVKKAAQVQGLNVTVPHKLHVIPYLDRLDDQAKRIYAVNTIVRTEEGDLVGHNTDGTGFLQSVLEPQAESEEPFLRTLKQKNVLLLGAGGAARAVAFSLGETLEGGKLWISNRTVETARVLAREVNEIFGNAEAIGEADIGNYAPQADLIINGTTKGQGGWRKAGKGEVMNLEAYSALAPANPASFSEADTEKPDFHRRWLTASSSDIEANNRRSMDVCQKVPPHVAFYDLVYHPEETVFLRHARQSGHRTMNGKAMIVAQAAHALFDFVCRETLEKNGKHNRETYRQIVETMHRAWR